MLKITFKTIDIFKLTGIGSDIVSLFNFYWNDT